ncbi:O-antigen translocase [uncultured Flavobacterium sp.]|uniref:O-antigen translocase n=1 Tax=uncultured Flavobacterium sp. TaxID=165435 RepID=UPI0030C88353
MNIFKQIAQKELFKITSLNSISVILKIIIGFVSSKVIAICIGPSGMALVGNLRNFTASVEGIATLGFTNGIVKYVAQKEDNQEELKQFLSTVFITLFCVILVLSGLLYFLANYLNQEIFGSDFQYEWIFKAFGLALPWYIASLVLVSVINGFGEFKKVIYINIIGNVLGLLITVGLIFFYKTFGALLAVILSPSVLFFVTLFFIHKKINLFQLIAIKSFDFSVLKPMSEYSLMALISMIFGPMVYLAIRNSIIENFDINQAGYWEAITRISNYYLLFLTTVLTVYFLPKLSKSTSNAETKKVIWSYYKGIIPVFLVGLILVYLLKNILIQILFTKEFLPISKLFFWQLLGDFFKALSTILALQFFAKKLTKAFIVTEIFSLTILWFSSIYLLNLYGIEGIVMAHAFTFFIYFVVLGIYFRRSWI